MDYKITSTAGFYGMTVSGGKVTEVTDGLEEMIQRIIMAIKTHLGERQLNTLTGLPWTEEILVKNPNLDQITSRARAYIMTIEGVTNVIQLDLVLNEVTRVIDWTLNVETTEGITGPFNVTS
jgi:hypothetical protein